MSEGALGAPRGDAEYGRREPGGRDLRQAVLRGLRGRCPACGEGRTFGKFLKVNDHCPACGEELHHQRADDMPPYVVMFITGHVIVYLLLVVERAYQPELWVHMALWIPAVIILSLVLLTPVKGALVGLQWGLGMHGFGGPGRDGADPDRLP